MKAVGTCLKGFEDIAVQEVKEISKLTSKKIIDGRIEIEYKTIDDIYRLIYSSRSLIKVYLLEQEFKFNKYDEIFDTFKEIKIKGAFKVKCNREGEHDFNSLDVEKQLGEIIFEQGHKVNLKEPETIVFVDIADNNCFIGYDLYEPELCKRDYKLKSSSFSLNSCFGYCLIRLSEWNEKEVLLDPYCKDGVIVIEAALFGKKVPVGYFRKDELRFNFDFEKEDKKIKRIKMDITGSDPLLHNIKNCEINSKLADVKKDINLSRNDIDWLDTKFKEKNVDKVITFLPSSTKRTSEKELTKFYKEFFYQLEYIIKDEGKMILALNKDDLILKSLEHFKVSETRDVWVGGLKFKVLECMKE